jgi:hypothetical protein
LANEAVRPSEANREMMASKIDAQSRRGFASQSDGCRRPAFVVPVGQEMVWHILDETFVFEMSKDACNRSSRELRFGRDLQLGCNGSTPDDVKHIQSAARARSAESLQSDRPAKHMAVSRQENLPAIEDVAALLGSPCLPD